MATFQEMGLSNWIVKATGDMGFEEATPIQEKTIPVVMGGADIIGQAQTGTGKTAAFAIPMIEKFDRDANEIKGLVLAPTRELAVQVAEEINKIGQFKGIKALPIYGGQDIERQIRSLKARPHIIVGTPGRLMDHMRRKTIKLQTVQMVVLDEADEMLNMGFLEDIETILSDVPNEAQTLLFSATMPDQIRKLANRFLKDPEHIKIQAKEVTVANIEQHYIELQERQKFDTLCLLLDIQSPDLAIIFGRTKRRVDELSEALSKRGYSAEGLHGDLTQARRDSVIRRFKEGLVEILVATDVAARGLDITGVTHVYNFDMPQDPESYVHRVGRTGRAGKMGLATTFVTPREIGHMRLIEQVTKRKIVRKPVPTFSEAVEGQQKIAVDKLLEAMESDDRLQYKELAQELLENNDSVTLLSAALKLITKEPDTTPVRISDEVPMRGKKPRFEGAKKPWDGRNRSDRPGQSRGQYGGERRGDRKSDYRGGGKPGGQGEYRGGGKSAGGYGRPNKPKKQS